MNPAERKVRIKKLWNKVRMFVRLRHSLNAVKADIEIREINEMLDQQQSDQDSDADGDFDSDEEFEDAEAKDLPWYQFNTNASTIKTWDSFFAFVIFYNLFWSPVAIIFAENFHEEPVPSGINFKVLDLFI